MLTPGVAFGAGDHPTTALCLRWLHRHRDVLQVTTLTSLPYTTTRVGYSPISTRIYSARSKDLSVLDEVIRPWDI